MSDKQLHEMSDEELLALDLNQYTVATDEPVNEPETVDTDTVEVVEESEVADEAVNENTQTDDESDVDYQSFYSELTKPFKANGREITVKDPKDMITLMQQGVNYSKKMEELKPKKAVLKTLEQHGLLDNDKLAFLIDLHNKDPKAIAKLVKDSEIDLYAFDTEQANEYQPQQVISPVSELQEVVDELYVNENFRRVLSDMTGSWDTKSKEIIANNPNVLRIFNEQVDSGLYDRIVGVIEQERMFGRLLNVPFIEAYVTVESQLNGSQQQSFTAPRPSQDKPVETNENKRKASVPNGNVNSGVTQVDLNKMSDAELLAYLKEHNL